jgi:hypothetical protein
MNNKVMVAGLRLGNMLSFIGTIGLLGSTWSQMVSATVEEVTDDTNAIMKFKQHKDNPTQIPINQEETLNHINEAQAALQNGDTESAQRHLDLAKQALMLPPG